VGGRHPKVSSMTPQNSFLNPFPTLNSSDEFRI
jgi:hypothetical protein